jgi:hypothetical protein
MSRARKLYAREAVKLASHKVAKRVAGERVHGQKSYIEEQNQGSDAYPESSAKEEATECVAPKEDEEDEAYIQEVAMEILQNERERCLTAITVFAAFTHRTGRRVEKKGSIVSFSIVVARDPESQRPNQNQQRRGKRPPAMVGIDEWRIKRREIRSPFVVRAFEGPKGCIEPESAEEDDDGK